MPMENKISTDIFTTINHREIDFYADKLQDGAIPAVFSCTELLEWLDKTGSRLFDEDLIMDYGIDCLRLYLLFEKTPKENDAPYYNSWNEGALEGIYKFLSRSRRMVLAAAEWNRRGNYTDVFTEKDYKRIQAAAENTKQKINECITRGNTTVNRHKIVSLLMELQKTLQKELKINEITAKLHAHAIETAVPKGEHKNGTTEPNPFQKENKLQEEFVIELCRTYIAITAPFSSNIAKILWGGLMDIFEVFSAN